MPSPRPVKPNPSSVVAFTLTRSAGTPICRARFCRISGMWEASLGGLGNHGGVYISHLPAALRQPQDHPVQQQQAGNTPIGRVAVGK